MDDLEYSGKPPASNHHLVAIFNAELKYDRDSLISKYKSIGLEPPVGIEEYSYGDLQYGGIHLCRFMLAHVGRFKNINLSPREQAVLAAVYWSKKPLSGAQLREAALAFEANTLRNNIMPPSAETINRGIYNVRVELKKHNVILSDTGQGIFLPDEMKARLNALERRSTLRPSVKAFK